MSETLTALTALGVLAGVFAWFFILPVFGLLWLMGVLH